MVRYTCAASSPLRKPEKVTYTTSSSFGSIATRVTHRCGSPSLRNSCHVAPRSSVFHSRPVSVPTYSVSDSVFETATVVIVPQLR